jgi:ATP-dependent RNA helicase RhlE
MLFSQLGLIDPLLKALADEGYSSPTPIQEQAIPSLLNGRDLLGCAQTGTGKTAAFGLPILQLMSTTPAEGRNRRDIRALILTPTRELALQIHESFETYGRYLPLKSLVIFGGVSQHSQTLALGKGVDILVATPGRLLDLMDQKFIHLHSLEFFVLDEADRMLDMGFVHDVKKVISRLPKRRQSLFFSATMPQEIQALADTILNNPIKVEVTPVSSTAETVDQKVYKVDRNDKRRLLLHILKDSSIDRALVFTRTKHGADKVARDLEKAGIRAAAIHGNKSQNARQKALGDFKSTGIRVLVATDIAARGIDVDALGFVINYEIPNVPETYVHRIGRTGRAGASGRAISFCDEEEQVYIRDIQKLIGMKIPVAEEHPYAADAPAMDLSLPLPRQVPASSQKGRENRQNSSSQAQNSGGGPKTGRRKRWFNRRGRGSAAGA